jgi:hypothetical protein
VRARETTRIVIAVGEESLGTFTGHTAVATAELLGQQATVFPSHHGGFLGGEFGYAGQPEAFARNCATSSPTTTDRRALRESEAGAEDPLTELPRPSCSDRRALYCAALPARTRDGARTRRAGRPPGMRRGLMKQWRR